MTTRIFNNKIEEPADNNSIDSKWKKEFQCIPPSVRPAKSLFDLLKEGENLLG
jgi:hypothetical protein